jgi:hypothetical protein
MAMPATNADPTATLTAFFLLAIFHLLKVKKPPGGQTCQRELLLFPQLSGDALPGLIRQPWLLCLIFDTQPRPKQMHLLHEACAIPANHQMQFHCNTFMKRQTAIQ